MQCVDQIEQRVRDLRIHFLANIVLEHGAAVDGLDGTGRLIIRQEVREAGVAAVVPFIERHLISDVVVPEPDDERVLGGRAQLDASALRCTGSASVGSSRSTYDLSVRHLGWSRTLSQTSGKAPVAPSFSRMRL